MRPLTQKMMVLLTVLALLVSMAPMAMAQEGDTATLTVVHNIESVPPVDVYVNEVANGTAVISALLFGDSVTLEVPAGEYTFFVTPAGALGPILLEADFTLEAGESYTIEATLDDEGNPVLAAVEPAAEATEEPMAEETEEPMAEETEEPMAEETEEPMAEETEEPMDEATEEPMVDSEAALGNLRDVTDGAGDLNFFGTAVDTFAVGDLLTQEDQPLTVFVPNDDAFNARLSELMELANDPVVGVATLQHHIVAGVYTAEDVVALAESGDALITLAGTPLTFELVDGNVVINGTATIYEADLAASNGVVHKIDAVMSLPSVLDVITVYNADVAEEGEEEDLETDFTTLVTAVETAGEPVTSLLAGEGPFTVFAPSDAAFNNLPPGVLEAVLNSPPSLVGVLGAHVVEQRITAEDLVDGATFNTFIGFPLTVSVDEDGNVFVFENVKVVSVITAANGNIIVVDNVIVPPRPEGTGDEDAEAPAAEATEEATETPSE